MSRIPTPSTRGTNYAGLFIDVSRSPSMAFDQAPPDYSVSRLIKVLSRFAALERRPVAPRLDIILCQLRRGPGPPAVSSTAARHSRLIGRIGGIGATSGSAVGAAIKINMLVCEPRRMNRL